MRPYSYFHAPTGTARPVLPTDFVHRRKWADAVEQYLTLITQSQITNINQQLESTAHLFVSNIISRVIAQLIGETDYGFSTIRATPAGALYVIQAGDLSATKIFASAAFHKNSSGDNIIITGTAGTQIKVCFIMFTVAAEVNVKLISGSTDLSGVMDFGGTDEPRGMVAPHGPAPLVCGVAENFIINLSGAVYIDGYCTYYKE